MGYIVRMPKLGLEMEQGTVLEWSVGTGDEIAEGDQVAEVESEKSIGEVDAREDGVLRRVYAEEGESVPPGTPIGIVAAADAEISDLEAEAEADLREDAPELAPGGDAAEATGAAADPTPEAGASAPASTGDAGGSAAAGGASSASASGGSGSAPDVRASPRAEKRAEELGVDLTAVDGTGPQGAITAGDVEAAAEASTDADEQTSAGEAVKASPRAEKRAEELGVDLTTVDGTGFEGAVTEDDVEAAADAAESADAGDSAEPTPPSAVDEAAGVRRIDEAPEAHRYRRATSVADPAVGEALFETMDAVRAAFEERVTMTDVLLAVASATLKDHPALNGTYAESTHQVRETQNVALAVAVDGDGLTTGVIDDVDERSLTEIVEARTDIGGGGGETQGATFTLANAAGVEADGRLINPPCVASLEVDPSGERAVPDGDGVDLRPLVTAGLTYDSRAVSSAEAAAFLDGFFERAEAASELVLSTYRGHE
ncbi:hypothetical protein G9464_01170 [Halostella sp. JP-L12]|uniref:E3 binding domain-containing protein n=1 Tax=Halostella TaxID=1843185 RepID=UPI000EF83950|nr:MULTISPECIES: E3 binding domain-containing protein [Halostella]NHN46210.1 hypothetical protein [Halostella sp. JP-L12]